MQVVVKLRCNRQQLGAVCRHVSPAAALADGSPHLAHVSKRAEELRGACIPVQRLLVVVHQERGACAVVLCVVTADGNAIPWVLGTKLQGAGTPRLKPLRKHLCLMKVLQQESIVATVGMEHGQDCEHPGCRREFDSREPYHTIGADIVLELVVHDTLRVRHRSELQGCGCGRGEDVLQPVEIGGAEAWAHTIPRLPRVLTGDHRADD